MARRLADRTTEEVAETVAGARTAVLVPVGSVEPHGPHLPLGTDTLISETAALRAAEALARAGVDAWVAPSMPYGVTEFAEGFAGTVSVPAGVLTSLLRAIAERLLADGWKHVCFVNNHLEPAHDAAVRAAVDGLPAGAASVACPLTKRWARTLSEEFKRGDCHAGSYETSLAIAGGATVREGHRELPAVGVSLSKEIRAGRTRFREMGMERAYTGSPAEATREEGETMYGKLVAMIVAEVTEALERRA